MIRSICELRGIANSIESGAIPEHVILKSVRRWISFDADIEIRMQTVMDEIGNSGRQRHYPHAIE